MITIQVNGVFEALEHLKKKNEDVLKNMNQGLMQIGFHVQGKVKESIAGRSDEPASVDTGLFLNSVIVEREGDEKTPQVTIFTQLDYPVYLEYGTSRIAARHHFQNTANRERTKVVEMMTAVVEKATR